VQPDESAWHALTVAEAVERLNSHATDGLDSAAAAQRLLEHGPNRLPQAARSGLPALFLRQFKDFMILVLLAAAVVAGFIGEAQDSIVILIIVTLNAVIGSVQQYRAENAIAALRELAAPDARVIRDGRQSVLPASELVPGDLVLLEAGAIVPADLRLLEGTQLQADESMLTGESQPVEKDPGVLATARLPVGDRANLLFRSTLVTRGHGRGVVVATGRSTELGGIAGLLSSAELLNSPLQQRLARFGRRLALVILAICALIFLGGLLRGEPAMLMLLTAVSLAVAAIPEALPAVVSISLAIGAFRLSTQRALVRTLPAVETLGSVSVICADKTGTLTMNRMRAEAFVTLQGSAQKLPAENELIACCLLLCNDVELDGEGKAIGEPTELALFEAAVAAGFDKPGMSRQLPRVADLPFTSERKRMTTVHQDQGALLAFCKGAPEVLLGRCRDVAAPAGSVPLELARWREEVESLGASGHRVLALACKRCDALPADNLDSIEEELTLLGLVGLIDPPREEVPAAVEDCKRAGITPHMITGDHPGTALAIAQRVGIAGESDRVMTGEAMEALDDAALAEQAAGTRVYARVSPAQKIRLVEALQSRGSFVAMTGDGVNDAPALKQADIGVAMGKRGTDVAREAADMVLLDDNFATIVAAVREGRRIFDNIRKFVKYTMTSNSGEIWTLALAPLFGMPLPLLPIHILWINLVTDGLPGLALTTQQEESRIMQRPPRPPRESLFAGGMWQHILLIGLLIGGISLGVQAWALDAGLVHWQTMVFTVLTFSQLVHVMVIRNETDSLFRTGLLQNRALAATVALTVLLQLAVIYVPLLNTVFRTAPLSAAELGLCLLLPLLVLLVVEGQKLVARR
jgi:Ca2+-transporting ATPase